MRGATDQRIPKDSPKAGIPHREAVKLEQMFYTSYTKTGKLLLSALRLETCKATHFSRIVLAMILLHAENSEYGC